MQVAILSNEMVKKELIDKGISEKVHIIWVTTLEELVDQEAQVYMDLLFENDVIRIQSLSKLFPRPVFINSVIYTLAELNAPFIRINAWNGFLKRRIMEIVVKNETQNEMAASVLSVFGWAFVTVPDKPGMIAARVISMIVNEAYYALEEGVSTKKDIDIAMKLGTNYPFGPFEWSEQIGLENIYSLLFKLAQDDKRYTIAGSLTQQIIKGGNVKGEK